MKKLIFLIFMAIIFLLYQPIYSQMFCNDDCYWLRTGNTLDTGKYLGTWDWNISDIVIKTNSIERMRIMANGGIYVSGGTELRKPKYPNDSAIFSVYKGQNYRGYIAAQEIVIVEASSWEWPDFVFSKNYKLLPLKELEKVINKDKHLPGIPTQGYIQNNGCNIADIHSKILLKVEELTLYLIELNKENSSLKKQIQEYEKTLFEENNSQKSR